MPAQARKKPEEEQYSLGKILGIWALGTFPMTIFAFWITPGVVRWFDISPEIPRFLVFWPFMICGLLWQFLLSCFLLHKPYGIFYQMLFSGLVLSLPSRLFRSNWMAVLIHGTEALVALWLVTAVILGG